MSSSGLRLDFPSHDPTPPESPRDTNCDASRYRSIEKRNACRKAVILCFA
ncbi:hypothetical protein RRSWK_02075 [Rhodopirellula sp. SWK7]|nr:hypothetical protein RRSWK_02075 [Rhodopirellula sp. SWK7]